MMPSWRSQFFYWMFRLSKKRSPLLSGKLSLEQQRHWLRKQGERYNQLPPDVALQDQQVEGCTAEWLCPHGALRKRAVLFLHGGGFTMGTSKMARSLAALIGRASQSPVLSLDYRLAPENPFPAAIEDIVAAFHWLVAQGIAANQIALVGESAGGTLALSAALSLRDAHKALPAALVLMSPAGDLTLNSPAILQREREDPMLTKAWMQSHFALYIGQNDPNLPLISPLFADLAGLPPLLIQVGEHEMLQNDAVRLAQRARQAEVSTVLEIEKGMWHGWQNFGSAFPESTRSVQRIGAFIQMHLGG